MKTRTLSEIDNLIIADIRQNPGTSYEQVVNRLSPYYRSRTYIKKCIKRLEAMGYIQDESTVHQAALVCAITE